MTPQTRAMTTTLQAERRKQEAAFQRRLRAAHNKRIEQEAVFRRRILVTHKIMVKVWPTNSAKIPPLEPITCSFMAHNYYKLWEPPPEVGVRLLIMAESHNTTDSTILERKIDPSRNPLLQELPHIGHLNVVHCLSYGESWLLDVDDEELEKTVRLGAKAVTRQFWKLLAALAGDLDFKENETDPLLTQDYKSVFSHLEGCEEAHRKQRLSSKLSIIERLKKRGILLVDCSATPLYKGGNNVKRINQRTGKEYYTKENKLSPIDYNNAIRAAWYNYSKHLIRHYGPKKFLILGKSVEQAITVKEVEKMTGKCGAAYLGAMNHPSCNTSLGAVRFIPYLQQFRELGRACEEQNE